MHMVFLQEAMHAEAHMLVDTSYGSLLVRCCMRTCAFWYLL